MPKDAEPSGTQRMVTDPVEPETEAARAEDVAEAWLRDELWYRLAPRHRTGLHTAFVALIDRIRAEARAAQHAATREACASRLETCKAWLTIDDLAALMRKIPLEDAPCTHTT